MEIRIFDKEIDAWRIIDIAKEVLIINGDRKLYIKDDDEPGYKITAFNDGYPMSIIPLDSTRIKIC